MEEPWVPGDSGLPLSPHADIQKSYECANFGEQASPWAAGTCTHMILTASGIISLGRASWRLPVPGEPHKGLQGPC